MFYGKKSFTLIEAIFVIVILAFILVGGFQIVGKLYERNYIAKQTSKFEFVSQNGLDQISDFLYHRIPLSVIGYNQSTGSFKYIGNIEEDEHYPVIEWIGYENEAMRERNMSGFIDLYASVKPYLKALDFNPEFVNSVLAGKFNGEYNITNATGILFAGALDRGDEYALADYNNSFGWHGKKAELVYIVHDYHSADNDTYLGIRNSDGSEVGHIKIYAKIYLADSAYAIALKKDLNQSKWRCGAYKWSDFKDNDLLLFYNYRPFRKDKYSDITFCADYNGSNHPEGNVTLLMSDVKSFKIRKVNSHLELDIQLLKTKADINISVSKQKVTF